MTQYIKSNESVAFLKQHGILDKLGIVDPVIFDVGANIGQSIENYRNILPTSSIYSFEPNPDAFYALQNRYSTDSSVYLSSKALADFKGDAEFHVTNVSEASSLLTPSPRLMSLSKDQKYNFKCITVSCETLDNYISSLEIDSIDILKLDVQGAELPVLKGAKRLLEMENISVIYTEITIAETYSNQCDLSSLLTYLQSFGYQLWELLPFTYTSVGRVWSANAIFLSKSAVESIEK